jgi:hypothetical protein
MSRALSLAFIEAPSIPCSAEENRWKSRTPRASCREKTVKQCCMVVEKPASLRIRRMKHVMLASKDICEHAERSRLRWVIDVLHDDGRGCE